MSFSGEAITRFICANINGALHFKLQKLLLEELAKKSNNSNYKHELIDRIRSYKENVDAIENEMIYLLGHNPLSKNAEFLRSISKRLLENSLAFYLGNETEKKSLSQLFSAIELKIEGKIDDIHKYSGTMVSMADADKILEWINARKINTELKSMKELLDTIEDLFNEIFPSLSIKDGFSLSWIRGDSYEKISNDYKLKIYDVEKISQYNISYQMSFLVGNIIDLVDAECVNLDSLSLLQQALRYGVNTRTAISICEKIFNDRYLAGLITQILGDKVIKPDEIVQAVKLKREKILTLLSDYPTYFTNVVENI